MSQVASQAIKHEFTTLERIVNILILNASFIDNLGLMNGKMGICIFFYHLALKTKSKIYEEFAGELLDEIYDEISIHTPLDFENGLTGIGWGIEYLVQNGFVDVNTNDTLSEIDNMVLKGILAKPLIINNDKELYGIGLYYLARLKGKPDTDENLGLLRIKTHMVYLLEDCKRLLTHNQLFDKKITALSIGQLCSVVYFLAETYKLQLFPALNKKLLSNIPDYIKQKAELSASMVERFSLIQLTKSISEFTKTQISNIQKTLLFKTSHNSEENAIPDFIKSACYSLLYPINYVEMRGFENLCNTACTLIKDEENWNNRIKNLNSNALCLSEGLAGIGLALLLYSDQKAKTEIIIQQNKEMIIT